MTALTAYVPALVFHEVERLDVVKMVRLLTVPEISTERLTPRCKALADLVMRHFRSRSVLPRIAEAVGGIGLFGGLDAEQTTRLAGVCGVATFEPGEVVFHEGQPGNQMQVVLQGEIAITVAGFGRLRGCGTQRRMHRRDVAGHRGHPFGDRYGPDTR